jgi:polysaccharide deacetylase 2 family uncharacterized protein YibQ
VNGPARTTAGLKRKFRYWIEQRIPLSASWRATLFVFFVFLASLTGCKKPAQRLPAGEIHAITRELAATAAKAAPPGTAVRQRPQASADFPDRTDSLDITLRLADPAQYRSTSATLLQALAGVATRHALTQDSPSESREGILYRYRHAGIPTHTIHIQFASSQRAAGAAPSSQASARLAIILDDLGNDRAAADAIFALKYPLTVSVLPNHTHSVDIAEEAQRRGYEVMLHLPMQAMGNETREAQELRQGMPAAEVASVVDQMLSAVPGVVGVNNHQGSQATADQTLMSELMPVLRDRGLFYIDSRTTAATLAFDAARTSGVPAAFRNVPFLDDVAETGAVRKQLQLALREAKTKGEAVAIGHPHPATLQALHEILPHAESQGVHLVFASDLVH